MTDVTQLLAAARQGDKQALDIVFSRLYADLRRLASARLHHNETPTLLNTTSLIHESYLRFVKAGQLQVGDRSHFMAYAARVMRSVVVDFARVRSAGRRGGHDVHVPLDTDVAQAPAGAESEALRLHHALDQLGTLDERLVRVVEMRYFAGMSEVEIAEALGVTERTVRRDWEKARVLLAAALE